MTDKNHATIALEQEISELKTRLAGREKAFEELERRFVMFTEEGPLCYQSLDIDGCFLNVNRKWLDTLGYSKEEVIGRRFEDFMTPEYKRNFWINFPKFKESGRVDGVEFELIGKDGATRFMNLTGMVGYDTEERFVQTHCLLHDITDRKLYEKALSQSAANFREFTEITDDLIIVSKLDGGIVFANPAAVERLGYAEGELRSMTMLELYAVEFRDEAREIFLNPDRTSRNRSSLPMLKKDGSHIEVETRLWHGDWSGIRSLYTVSKDVTAEGESLHKFNTFFYRNPCPMTVTILPERVFVDVNDAFLASVGYSREEVLGKTSAELGIFPDAGVVAEIGREMMTTGSVKKKELRVRSNKGDLLYGIFSGEAVKIHGRQYFLSAMLGITELKRLEMELRKSEQKFREISETTPDWIWALDVNGRYTYSNPSVKRLLGYQPDEIVGTEALLHVHPDDGERVRLLLEDSMQNSTGWTNFELRQIRKDGSVRNFESSAVPSVSQSGSLEGFRGIDRDVTDRNRAQAELKRTAELLKVIVENIAIPIGLSTGTLQYAGYLNPKWTSLFGYTLDDMPTVSEWWPLVYPDEAYREEIAAEWNRRVEKALRNQTEIEPMITTVRCKDGADRVIEWRVNSTGTWNIVHGVDLTDYKRLERELRESEEKYRVLREKLPDWITE